MDCNPPVTIPETGFTFSLEAMAYAAPVYPDGFAVRVCTGTPNSRADFDTTHLISVPACTGSFTEYSASLDAYVGQTVYFAIIQNSTDQDKLWVDNVEVFKPCDNEINMVGITLPRRQAMGGTLPVSGTLLSKGSQPLTSFVLSYTVNGGEPVSETVNCNVSYGQTYNFTASTPVALATDGTYAIEVTISLPNGVEDASPANNSASGSVFVYDPATYTPRTVLLENFTTAQCPNCPSGHDRIHNALASRDNVIWMTIHAGYYTDIMTTADHSTLCWFFNSSANGGTYAPAAMLDRRRFDFCDIQSPVFFPDNSVGAYIDEALDVPASASVEISNLNFNDATRELTMTVSGELETTLSNPRLSVYIVQDSIIASQSGAGSDYQHDNVMRASILDGTWGKPIAQGAFSEQISYTMPEKIGNINLNAWCCRVVAFVSNYNSADMTDCAIANATMSDNIQAPYHTAGIESAQVEMALYPNPATDYVVLSSSEELQEVKVVNTLGQVVYTNNSVNGSELVVDTRDMAAGMYIATVKTQNGVSAQRFNVVR